MEGGWKISEPELSINKVNTHRGEWQQMYLQQRWVFQNKHKIGCAILWWQPDSHVAELWKFQWSSTFPGEFTVNVTEAALQLNVNVTWFNVLKSF